LRQVVSSNSVTPAAKTSARCSSGESATASGATSISLAVPCMETMMFEGRTSR
jgi:hypothetical protein